MRKTSKVFTIIALIFASLILCGCIYVLVSTVIGLVDFSSSSSSDDASMSILFILGPLLAFGFYASIFCGILALCYTLMAVGVVVTAATVLKNSNKNNLISLIVIGGLTLNPFAILGGIFGLTALRLEETTKVANPA